MLTRTLQHASAVPTPTRAEVDAYLGSLAELSPLAPEMSGPQPDAHDVAEAKGLGCVRGLRYAVAAEILAVLFVFGLWRLWHLVIR